ncbi:hypothetical protein MKD41_01415 [Lutibacter sp. A64]|uniref:hypothetical protein n=1 Tax=Lutibacter sp. A64 TaxID=2918526 RepID=UPI001F05A258|nr:hypothetical protein [Lutibacter sp. A64]UMB54149.1 hypothetical protein MKD41_01415 [Lutibacter sp. A64]
MALMTNYFMGSPPLKGYTSKVNYLKKSTTTGVFFKNILNGNLEDLDHPWWIKTYLDANAGPPPNDYLHYRQAMINFINNHEIK